MGLLTMMSLMRGRNGQPGSAPAPGMTLNTPAAPAVAPTPAGPNPGLLSAFSGNPGFQSNLASILNGQGPGTAPPAYTPPTTPISTTIPTAKKPQSRLSELLGGSPWMGGSSFLGNAMPWNGDNAPWATSMTNWFGRQEM